MNPDIDTWLNNQRNRPHNLYSKPFVGSRGYSHFDVPIDLYDRESLARFKSRVRHSMLKANWQFFPFIKEPKTSRRFRKPPSAQSDTAPFESRNQKHHTHLKSRPIMRASHGDAAYFSYIGHLINEPYEARINSLGLSRNVLAYRPGSGRNNVDFAKEVFRFLELNDRVACLLIDVSGFFDTLEHSRLLDVASKLLGDNYQPGVDHAMRNITAYRYVAQEKVFGAMKENHRPYLIDLSGSNVKRICKLEDYQKLIERQHVTRNKSGIGIPQGSPISGLLANLYLLDFDRTISEALGNLSASMYRRYSDDILIICPEEKAQQIYALCKRELVTRGLSLSDHKTEAFAVHDKQPINIITRIEPSVHDGRERIQYLGLEWDGHQIILRPSTVGKRYRPKNPLNKKYWRYSAMAASKVHQKGIRRQRSRTYKTAMRKP